MVYVRQRSGFALGSGIGSNVPTDIVTTVNQCHLDGNVWINTGKSSSKQPKENLF